MSKRTYEQAELEDDLGADFLLNVEEDAVEVVNESVNPPTINPDQVMEQVDPTPPLVPPPFKKARKRVYFKDLPQLLAYGKEQSRCYLAQRPDAVDSVVRTLMHVSRALSKLERGGSELELAFREWIYHALMSPTVQL